MRILFVPAIVLGLAAAQSMPAQSTDDVTKSGKEHAKRAEGGHVGKPGPGMVWVDYDKKMYFRQGSPEYGKSKKGAYMSEGEAVNSGYADRTEKPLTTPNDPNPATK